MYSVFEPRLSARDKYSVVKALFNNNISGTSPIINEFEEKCANEFNRKYAETCGTIITGICSASHPRSRCKPKL